MIGRERPKPGMFSTSNPDHCAPRFAAFRRALPYAAFLVLAALIYGKSAGYGFILLWDDAEYVAANELIRSFTFTNLAGMFTTPILGNIAPLQLLSYCLDHLVWGLDPAGYHITNVALHGLNACLLYVVISRIAGERRIAFLATLLFVVHPLNVENVAWVAERKTLLAAVFSLLSLNRYMTYRERGGRWAYAISLLCAVCGILSKATAVVIPLLFAAYEYYLQRERRSFMPIAPFFFLSAGGAVLALWAQRAGGAFTEGPYTFELLATTIYPTMLTIYWKYLGLLIAPFGLSGYYDTSLHHGADLAVLLSAAGWIVLFFLVFKRGTLQVRFWFLWFCICFLPTSNLVPLPVYYADRYLYLPAVGLFVLVSMALVRVSGWLELQQGTRTAVAALAAAGAFLVLFYGMLAFQRLDVWRNDLSLWEDTAAKSPRQYKARLNLGAAYENAGRLVEAEREYLQAIAIYPSPYAVENLKVVQEKLRIVNSGR